MTRSVNARRRAERERHREAARARLRRLTPTRISVVLGPLAGFRTLAELRAAGEDVGEVVASLPMSPAERFRVERRRWPRR